MNEDRMTADSTGRHPRHASGPPLRVAPRRSRRRHKTRRRADMPLLGGVRPPIAALLVVLLAVAATTVVLLRDQERATVDSAVLTAQERIAEDGALSLRASLDESVTDLRRAARSFGTAGDRSDAQILDGLDAAYDKWRGKAVIDPARGTLLAAGGETIPLNATGERRTVDGVIQPKLVRLGTGETRVLVFASLAARPGAGPRLLVTSSTLSVPTSPSGDSRATAVFGPDGAVLAANGPAQARKALLTAGGPIANAQDDGTGRAPGGSRAVVHGGDRIATGYGAIAAADHERATPAQALGLTVATAVRVDDSPVALSTQIFGLACAGLLIAIALLISLLLYLFLQRPLLRLYLEGRRLAGGDLARGVAVPRFGEGARIGLALERLRLRLLGAPHDVPPGPARRRVGAGFVLALCAVLVLLWSVPLLFLVQRGDSTVSVPRRLVADQQLRTDTIAARVRKALGEGYADLAATAQTVGDLDPNEVGEALERMREESKRYRSLYVLRNGTVTARSGEVPQESAVGRVQALRDRAAENPGGGNPGGGEATGEDKAGKGQSGNHEGGGDPAADDRAGRVVQVNTSGKEPVIAAYAAVPGQKDVTVVGEFWPRFLVTLVSRPGMGRVHLVDSGRRIIAADGREGFLAFDRLSGHDLDRLTQEAARAHRSRSRVVRGEPTVITAAAPLKGTGATRELDWQVVSAQPGTWTTLPEYVAQRRTMLAGLLGSAAAVACLGWLYIVVVRPLRSLAAHAENLADGDRRTVLFPQHHDEVGAVMRTMELIRQQIHEEPRTRIRTPHGRN
ncbi:HAMP domain-containing protein [Streptomyces sp. NPDC056480]|uniref:HAMP domain-containing protein n=1 Tax=Streptomyces sp. NPDC056480 TaxID=3345833 RepID=UPI0036BEC636